MRIKFWSESLKGKTLQGLWHTWKDIRLDLRETGWEGMDCMNMGQDRDQQQAPVNTVMNI